MTEPSAFTCSQCNRTFEKARSDEDAMVEAEERFGDDLEHPVVVCDDCYREMTTALPIEQWRRERRAPRN